MRQNTYSLETAEAVRRLLEQKEYPYQMSKLGEDQYEASFFLSVYCSRVNYLFYRLKIGFGGIHICAEFPMSLTWENMTKAHVLAEYFSYANHDCNGGKAEPFLHSVWGVMCPGSFSRSTVCLAVDMESGEIHCYSSVNCENGVPPDQTILNTIRLLSSVYDLYADGIGAILFDDMPARCAYSKCEYVKKEEEKEAEEFYEDMKDYDEGYDKRCDLFEEEKKAASEAAKKEEKEKEEKEIKNSEKEDQKTVSEAKKEEEEEKKEKEIKTPEGEKKGTEKKEEKKETKGLDTASFALLLEEAMQESRACKRGESSTWNSFFFKKQSPVGEAPQFHDPFTKKKIDGNPTGAVSPFVPKGGNV